MSIFEYDEELHKKTLLDAGYEKGCRAGEMLKLIAQISKKISQEKTIEEIAEDLVEDPSVIEPIYLIITSSQEPLTSQEVLGKLEYHI